MGSSSALTEPVMAIPRTCTVLDVDYFIGDLRAATALVLDRARSGAGGYSCLCGVHGIVTAQHNADMMDALHQSWLNFPDGAPVAWLMRRFGAGTARRVAGPDLMPLVIDAGQGLGIRHFLFGSTPEVLDRLQSRLVQQYPRAIIAGAISPPFRPLTEDEDARMAQQIIDSGAEVVWVGLGLPKAGPVAAAQRGAVQAGRWARGRGRIRFPRGNQAARSGMDAELRAQVAAPAPQRAAQAGPPLCRDQHRVRGPGRDRHHRRVRPRRAARPEPHRAGRRTPVSRGRTGPHVR